MQKLVVKAITAVAIIAILFAGTGDQLNTINLIVIVASGLWLTLVAIATLRRKHGNL